MNNAKIIKHIILGRNSDALFLEDVFDNALLGSAIPCGQRHVAIYDSDQCIKILMKVFNLGEIEAFEQFLVTTELSNPSENKPILFSDFSKIKNYDSPDISGDMTLEDFL